MLGRNPRTKKGATLTVAATVVLIILLGCDGQTIETATPEDATTTSTSLAIVATIAPTATTTPTLSTPTYTVVPVPTVTPTSTSTAAATNTPTPTPQPTATATPTAAPTQTYTPTPTATPFPTHTSTPSAVTAKVVRIIDGDTIEVEIGEQTYRVRYIGMDTPEQGDPFFAEATEANRQLVEGKPVIVEKDVSDTDRYGRLLLYVYLQDGTFVNAELVRLGYAQVATYPPDIKHQDLFLQLQIEAREAGRGFWAQPAPTVTSGPAATPQPPSQGEAQVIIKHILFDGAVPRVESDEYAEISNTGSAPINIGGWRLNAGAPGQDFVFPSFDLQPGQSCRVYTNENHPDHCGFSFGSGKAIWNNKGDCGYLYDASGAEVSRYCY